MPLSELTKLAAAEGCDAQDVEHAMRSENRRDELIGLLAELLPPDSAPPTPSAVSEPDAGGPAAAQLFESPTSARSSDDGWEMVEPQRPAAKLVVPIDDDEEIASTSGLRSSMRDALRLSLQTADISEDSIYAPDDSDGGEHVAVELEQPAQRPKDARRQSISSWGLRGLGDAEAPQRDSFHAFCILANLIDQNSGRVLLTLMEMEASKMDILFAFFDDIFAHEVPSLHAHFTSVGIQPQMFLIEWLFTLFAKALPQCCTAWIWDHIFCFGDLWIFKAALGLLKLLEPHLLVQDEMILGKRALGLS